MNYKSPTKRLKSIQKEVQKHINSGNLRIKSYYLDSLEPPESYPELDEPPHQTIMEGGASLIHFASDGVLPEFNSLGHPANDTELLLYGVGMERLLSGIHLKIDPQGYIDYMDDKNGRSPPFGKSKQLLVEDLADTLDTDQRGVLCLVLEIVREQRNNEAHIGFHHRGHYQFTRVVLEVAFFLLQNYADIETSIVDCLASEIEEHRLRETHSSLTVEFDPTDSFEW